MEGWISLHRKLIESEIWEKPPLYIKVWVYLLLSAQHKQYKGLKPGQVLTSIPEIIEGVSWMVGARRERPTKDQVFQVLEFLRGKAMKSKRSQDESNEGTPMITTTKATHKMLVTICNYGVYQDRNKDESNDESNDEKTMNPPRKQRAPDNINNNDNNDNNELNNLSAEIKNFRSRYSSELLQVIDDYLDFIRETRKSKTVSDSIIRKIMIYFNKYTPVQVEYAIRQHMSMEDKKSAKEEYTFGIIRNSTEEEAAHKLIKLREKVREGGGRTNSSKTSDYDFRKRLEEMEREGN